MTNLPEIRYEVERAAELLATKPVRQWGQWVLYLLDVLDSEAKANRHSDAYTLMLADIRNDITEELERRLW
jgi:hypothetical protein